MKINVLTIITFLEVTATFVYLGSFGSGLAYVTKIFQYAN